MKCRIASSLILLLLFSACDGEDPTLTGAWSGTAESNEVEILLDVSMNLEEEDGLVWGSGTFGNPRDGILSFDVRGGHRYPDFWLTISSGTAAFDGQYDGSFSGGRRTITGTLYLGFSDLGVPLTLRK